MATKQIACNLCGRTFVCNNGMWSTTCTCAKDQPELLLRAQKLRDAIGRAGFGVMETSGEWSLHCTTEAAQKAERVERDLIADHLNLQEAVRMAIQFIRNGIETGYITLPSSPDPAHDTLPTLESTLAKLRHK